MTLAWLRAHNAGLVLVLSTAVGVGVAVAGSTSFVAPRQPIPLIWPLAMVQAGLALLILEVRFGALPLAAVRAVTDRLIACLVLLALVGGTVLELRLVGAPSSLVAWVCVVAALGLAVATFSSAEAWAVAIVVGLVGVGAEFVTPIAPISRNLESPVARWGAVALLLAGAAAHVAKPMTRLGQH